jgi:hypothetical protein
VQKSSSWLSIERVFFPAFGLQCAQNTIFHTTMHGQNIYLAVFDFTIASFMPKFHQHMSTVSFSLSLHYNYGLERIATENLGRLGTTEIRSRAIHLSISAVTTILFQQSLQYDKVFDLIDNYPPFFSFFS